jgi:predicted dehydrogenase
MRIGVIGCGSISGIYFQNLKSFEDTHVVACADLDMERARDYANWLEIEALTPEAMLAREDIELIVNLTVPKAHYSVTKAALEAGKHVYVEKPLAVELMQGMELIKLAEAKQLSIGCAPDTVLGSGIQTCKSLIENGELGDLVGANLFMLCPGHESWHPSPEFYYEQGGGPLFDMGPYYLSALIQLMGPISAVSGAARATFPTRTITSAPKAGTEIPVETPTHIAAQLELRSGAIAQFTASFDVQRTALPPFELYGSEGTLLVPDPNTFGAPVKIWRKGASDWEEVPLSHPYDENSRGLGVFDQVRALREGRPPRASGQIGMHVLEAMHGVLESAESGARVGMRFDPGD